tara:strand:- start:2359 stop:3861 length:1503 start_codon:yes stop_codon:yes gene_type:complete
MINWKSKYLEMKLKYIHLKKKYSQKSGSLLNETVIEANIREQKENEQMIRREQEEHEEMIRHESKSYILGLSNIPELETNRPDKGVVLFIIGKESGHESSAYGTCYFIKNKFRYQRCEFIYTDYPDIEPIKTDNILEGGNNNKLIEKLDTMLNSLLSEGFTHLCLFMECHGGINGYCSHETNEGGAFTKYSLINIWNKYYESWKSSLFIIDSCASDRLIQEGLVQQSKNIIGFGVRGLCFEDISKAQLRIIKAITFSSINILLHKLQLEFQHKSQSEEILIGTKVIIKGLEDEGRYQLSRLNGKIGFIKEKIDDSTYTVGIIDNITGTELQSRNLKIDNLNIDIKNITSSNNFIEILKIVWKDWKTKNLQEQDTNYNMEIFHTPQPDIYNNLIITNQEIINNDSDYQPLGHFSENILGPNNNPFYTGWKVILFWWLTTPYDVEPNQEETEWIWNFIHDKYSSNNPINISYIKDKNLIETSKLFKTNNTKYLENLWKKYNH